MTHLTGDFPTWLGYRRIEHHVHTASIKVLV